MSNMSRAEQNNRQYDDYLHEQRFEHELYDYNECEFAIIKENAKSSMIIDYSSALWVANCIQQKFSMVLYGGYELWGLHPDRGDILLGDYESLIELLVSYNMERKLNLYWYHAYGIICTTYTYSHITNSVTIDTMRLEL